MSEQLIFKKMADIMAATSAIGKNTKNTTQGFMYRGIDDVYNALHGILAEHRVFSTPEVLEEKSEERTTRNGGALIYRILKIRYTFYAEDGSSVSCIVEGEGMDSGDKASNKAMAIAHKYALTQVFTIPTQDMADPDNESHEVEPKPEGSPRQEVIDKISAKVKAGGFTEADRASLRERVANSDLEALKELLGQLETGTLFIDDKIA